MSGSPPWGRASNACTMDSGKFSMAWRACFVFSRSPRGHRRVDVGVDFVSTNNFTHRAVTEQYVARKVQISVGRLHFCYTLVELEVERHVGAE